MACSRDQFYPSTCCHKMSLPYQVEKMIPEEVVLEVGRKKGYIQQYAFFFLLTNSAHAHQYTLAQMYRRDAKLLLVDNQMTDKWLVGTPPPGSIVIALWDWAIGISYREGARERESRARVSFYTNKTSASHRMWLRPPLSTVANLIALSIWVTASEDTV